MSSVSDVAVFMVTIIKNFSQKPSGQPAEVLSLAFQEGISKGFHGKKETQRRKSIQSPLPGEDPEPRSSPEAARCPGLGAQKETPSSPLLSPSSWGRAGGGRLLPSSRNEKIHCSTATVWILRSRGTLTGAKRSAMPGASTAPPPALTATARARLRRAGTGTGRRLRARLGSGHGSGDGSGHSPAPHPQLPLSRAPLPPRGALAASHRGSAQRRVYNP